MSVYSILLAVHVLVCLAVIGVVLLQHGKGADAGAAFGSGASGTVFGSRGAASFLSKVTAVLAASFFGTSLVLAMITGSFDDVGSVMDGDGSSVIDERVPESAGEAAGEGSGEPPAPAPSE
ncbi:MAG: preprotein translocase subunit SecG [Arhodomonas sp.]|nr:preprotein translocase subunit SecG [Arhodomonas sp.]